MQARTTLGLILSIACLAGACASGGGTRRSPDPERARRDSAEIHAAILRGAGGFERGDPDAILDRYARDVVLAYPGEPDMDYATLAKAYAELRRRPPTTRAATVPTFDELLVVGDMAVARLRWTTTITTPERATTRRMKDLQVWRREVDGRWMFVRGMHYREPEPATGP